MLLTVIGVLVVVGFVLLIASVVNPPRVGLWLSVLFLYLIELLRLLPVGK